MVPAAERLAAGDAHRVHRRRSAGRRRAAPLLSIAAAQVGLHQLAVAEGGIHRRFEQPPVVLAEFLGLVEREVGLDDHRVDVGVLDPRQHRAAAGLDAQRVAGDVDVALQAGEDAVEHRRPDGSRPRHWSKKIMNSSPPKRLTLTRVAGEGRRAVSATA